MRLAIIPARGGSKRIPRKNIKPLAGLPMIAWPIKAALDSNLFDKVIVSTDDHEILDIAVHYGAEAPFVRPDSLADDNTPTRPVILHAIEEMETRFGNQVSIAACIYATAAFLLPEDLAQALAVVDEHGGFAFGALAYPHPVQRAFKRRPDGQGVSMLFPEHRLTRTQDLEPIFHDAGMFHLGTREAFVSNEPVFSEIGNPVIIPPLRGLDIDEPEDWERAELALKMLGLADEQVN